MYYFYGFIVFVLLFMSVLLFYNEVLKNEKLLIDLQEESFKLSGKIHCAKSEHDCDKAQEYKLKLNEFEECFKKNNEKFNKILSVYNKQYKLVSIFLRKNSFKKPQDFK